MRKLTDLTDEEIRFILTDIFEATSVEDISRNNIDQEITCIMQTENWSINEGETHFPILDEVQLTLDCIDVNFDVTDEDIDQWRKYLVAKRILLDPSYLNDNPYLVGYIRFEPQTTLRGFNLLEFSDWYGESCNLQESSIATEKCIWLGLVKANPQILHSKVHPGGTGWVSYPIPEDVHINTRMHLSQKMAKELGSILLHFAETGEILVCDNKESICEE